MCWNGFGVCTFFKTMFCQLHTDCLTDVALFNNSGLCPSEVRELRSQLRQIFSILSGKGRRNYCLARGCVRKKKKSKSLYLLF